MHGRQCDEDNDWAFSPTSWGHQMRGNFLCHFPRVCFVQSPRACPGGPGMAWARRMDEGPNLGENEEPGARLAFFTVRIKKRLSGASSGSWLEMLLLISYVRSVSFYSVLVRASRCERLVEG
jgi:hypothetical protein